MATDRRTGAMVVGLAVDDRRATRAAVRLMMEVGSMEQNMIGSRVVSPSVKRIPTGPTSPEDRLWTVHDVSSFLGVPVSTLYQWRVQSRGPACRRMGRHLRYRPEDVREWVAGLGDARVAW